MCRGEASDLVLENYNYATEDEEEDEEGEEMDETVTDLRIELGVQSSAEVME